MRCGGRSGRDSPPSTPSRRAQLPAEAIAERVEHRERRLVYPRAGSPPPRSRRAACTPAAAGAHARTSARSRGSARSRRRSCAPSSARSCRRRGRRRRPVTVAQRRAAVAEDARVAVLVGRDLSRDARGLRARGQDGASGARGPGTRDTTRSARSPSPHACARPRTPGRRSRDSPDAALREGDRPLVREEPEAREVLDVVGTEEDVPARAARRTCSSRRARRSSSSLAGMPAAATGAILLTTSRQPASRSLLECGV